MIKTPKANRLHIGIFGKRNAGKSSLLNLLTHQDISVVSDVAGTTTDTVEKSMEFLPLGPVVFIDTAGIDDDSVLGKKRIEKTKKVFDRTDIALIVSDSLGWNSFEKALFEEFVSRDIPVVAIINKQDLALICEDKLSEIKKYTEYFVCTNTVSDENAVEKIRETLINVCPDEFINPPSLLGDLISPKDTVVLVVPVDKEAPKGRLILPQVQAIRDILDNGCKAFVTKDSELKETLQDLRKPPALVVTDSQAFRSVNETVDSSIPMTSFSILFARLKGDLKTFCYGAKAIDKLQDGDKILMCESCSHHPIQDDIGRVKIPSLLRKKTEKNLLFEFHSSHDFVENLRDYSLIIHCGACMTNRREILSRIMKCRNAGVPVTNYGITIAHCLGILDRAVSMFSFE